MYRSGVWRIGEGNGGKTGLGARNVFLWRNGVVDRTVALLGRGWGGEGLHCNNKRAEIGPCCRIGRGKEGVGSVCGRGYVVPSGCFRMREVEI